MKILFIINNNYPDGDAGAIRQHALAKILASLGHEVHITSVNRERDIAPQIYDGISYQAFGGRYLECKRHLKSYLDYCDVPDILFLNSIPFPAFSYAKKYAIKHNVQLIHDCVEWYSLDEFSPMDIDRLIRCYLVNTLINRFKLDKHFKVISISSYLDNYFTRKGIKSVRVPVIMSGSQVPSKKQKDHSKLHLTYAGSPGGKDYLANIISAIEMLDESERECLEFTLLGVDNDDLMKITKKSVDDIKKLNCVHAVGRVPRAEVLKHLEYTDFTVLIRSGKARYAKAGFPTKVVESLFSGTPVILNLTSDLDVYLRNNYDCLTALSEKPEDIIVTLRRALSLSYEQKKNMCLNARKTAEEKFDLKNYMKIINEFLEN